MIFTVLKIAHLLALVFGSAASLGNIYLALSQGPHELAAPAYTNMLRKLYRLTALGAIAVFWATGILMVFIRYGVWIDGYAFNVKIALVALLSAIIIYLNVMAPIWARRGGPPRYVPALHYSGTFLLLLSVIFAGFAFN